MSHIGVRTARSTETSHTRTIDAVRDEMRWRALFVGGCVAFALLAIIPELFRDPHVPPQAQNDPSVFVEPSANQLALQIASAEHPDVAAWARSGGDPNAVSLGGATLLGLAFSRNNLDVFRGLLEAGADPNQSWNGAPAICHAAGAADGTPLRLLLDYGATLEVVNRVGDTPLMCAVRADRLESVGLLLERGARVDPVNMMLQTPLQVAVLRENADACAMLLEAGASPTFQTQHGISALVYAQQHSKNPAVRRLFGLEER